MNQFIRYSSGYRMRWFVCILLAGYALAKHEEYDGSALFSVKVQNVEEADYFNTLEYPFDIWQYANLMRNGMVLVPRNYVQLFKNELSAKGMEFIVETENIKESLELEDRLFAEKAKSRSARANDDLTITWDKIYNLAEVNDYIEKVAAAYPNLVTLANAGKSVEGRDIPYLKISSTNFKDIGKPIIFIDSLLHAREWVTLPATMYAIDKLVVNVTEPDLIDNYDWIIVPVANPDGYEFTHVEGGNRFWRKNRRTGVFPEDACLGVDLNRNFDINFGTHSSNFACTDTYHGPSAFSEPETSAIRDILQEYEGRIELFLDIHSFGSMILYGWGNGQLPPNAFTLQAAGVRMAEAIDAVKREYNNNYRVGNSALILYKGSGTAMDYGLAVNIPLSYVYELPGYHGVGQTIFGFLVHPDFIEHAGMETWEGIKAGARFVSRMRSRP